MKYLILILLAFNHYCFGQVIKQKSLIVSEYLKDGSGQGNYTYLVSYNFQNGKLVSKDTIFGAPVFKENISGSYVRFDLGRNSIYKNRYVISGAGDVVDLNTKSLVTEENDNFIKTTGDSIIFYRNNAITGTGYLILDLHTKNYGFVKDTNFMAIKGFKSPLSNYGLEVDQSKLPYSIILNTQKGKAEIIVEDCGFGTSMATHSNSRPRVPIFWIDNSNFIYAKYPHIRFQDCKVEIRNKNINTKTDNLIVTIDSIPQATSNAYFYRDKIDSLIFHCEKGDFIISLKKKKSFPYKYVQIGNLFQIEIEKDSLGSKIKYNNELIGKFPSAHSVTTDDYYAAEYYKSSWDFSYCKDIKIWNTITKDWITIEIPWVCAIIGWKDNDE